MSVAWTVRRSGPRTLAGGSWANARRRTAAVLVVMQYLLVLGFAGWYNAVVYLQRAALQAEAERYRDELARAAVVRAELNRAVEEGQTLRRQREQLYRQLPDGRDAPAVLGRLVEAADAVGVRLLDVQYSPPSWSGLRGRADMYVAAEGAFAAIFTYVASINASLPSVAWETLELTPADVRGEKVVLHAELRLDMTASRPKDVLPWAVEPVRVEHAADGRNAFAALALADDPLPGLSLHGVLRRGAQKLALLAVDGATHLVEPGQTLAGVSIVDITGDSVIVRSAGQVLELRWNH